MDELYILYIELRHRGTGEHKMGSAFPPSSPIGAGSASYNIEADPFLEFAVGRKQLAAAAGSRSERQAYPTPHPSSTLGRSSSPVREADSDEEQEVHERSWRLVEIVLDPRSSAEVVVGRQRAMCDVCLPRGKHISRRHATLSYEAATNRVRLYCSGTNGLVVSFPRQLSYELVRQVGTDSVFELVTETSDGRDHLPRSEKELVKRPFLTSFVLFQGETVDMPFIQDTILDFRQCEARMSLLDIGSDEENSNVTETEDEMTLLNIGSDDIRNGVRTPVKRMYIHRSDDLPTQAELERASYGDAVEEDDEMSDRVFDAGSALAPDSSFSGGFLHTPFKQKLSDNSLLGLGTDSPLSPAGSIESFQHDSEVGSPGPVQKKRKETSSINDQELIEAEDILKEMECRGIDPHELQHVLANHLALSNVQQVPLSQLQDVNSTISTLGRKELRALLTTEKCIGVIYRVGKDAAGKPLDEEYYYDLENDSNQDRRQLVLSLKGGRTSLRSCRRVHKQYFWKKPAK
ncbi:AFR689Wp [Eremothecium gossypii ATCC 10895]|uniref:AFR689Wp n=1 Tax=Eremothecium gossypii (strain ATCC 10895 / CBS 109.51 / FGSC 9923 / NRRL Y-1056) TaxID=284811 RepID=Q751Y6_EREGS|nr:AFR689Wp [Eremothecium gossypii ATCC 10895]AAS54061.1 AFR689Wp [Eremothecium gossypii ATCC 10895]AEY98376.1 FAFR689Wp [Eremothecium gossypii FDAG1]